MARRETRVLQVWTSRVCLETEEAPVSPVHRDPLEPLDLPEDPGEMVCLDSQVLKETWERWELQDLLEDLEVLEDLDSLDLKATTVSLEDLEVPEVLEPREREEIPVCRALLDQVSLIKS